MCLVLTEHSDHRVPDCGHTRQRLPQHGRPQNTVVAVLASFHCPRGSRWDDSATTLAG